MRVLLVSALALGFVDARFYPHITGTKTFSQVIGDYGCWCRFTSEGALNANGAGPVEDDLDAACKFIANGFACAIADSKAAGEESCEPWALDEYVLPDIHFFFEFEFALDYDWNSESNRQYIIKECEAKNAGNVCATAACKVELWGYMKMVNYRFYGRDEMLPTAEVLKKKISMGWNADHCVAAEGTTEYGPFMPVDDIATCCGEYLETILESRTPDEECDVSTTSHCADLEKGKKWIDGCRADTDCLWVKTDAGPKTCEAFSCSRSTNQACNKPRRNSRCDWNWATKTCSDAAPLSRFEFPSEHLLEKNYEAGVVQIFDEWTLSFTLNVHSAGDTSSWRSILHIGDTNYDRQPGLWFDKNTDYDFWFATGCDEDHTRHEVAAPAGFGPGMHDFVIVGQGSRVTMNIDGEDVMDEPRNNCAVGQWKKLWLGNPKRESADATISNIKYISH